ncbi:MAG TPA: class I SAM-dependent methyltransferase [Vicinamibacterales bacterium]|nr:class I SAM-dependent methyltransferase [Vicinamibacterales bacterium]
MAIIHPRLIRALCFSTVALVLSAIVVAQQETKPFEPVVGQAGKDVVWVPSPEETVQKMMEMGKITAQDYVIDLGSGDGRNVIAAAKRGARALGVEYNQDMVDLSKRRATEAGVTEKAQFVQGDMYEADISKASVMALFLLPQNLNKLRPKFLALKPGSRIVSNTFTIENWEPVESETVPNCTSWCTVLLYIVPANVAGAWQMPQGTLTLQQDAQDVTGTLGSTAIADVKLRGEELTFNAGGTRYTARVNGDAMEGTAATGTAQTKFRATRAKGARE